MREILVSRRQFVQGGLAGGGTLLTGGTCHCRDDAPLFRFIQTNDLHVQSPELVLSGHLHLTGMPMRRTVCHFALSGTASAPSDRAAVVEVFQDRISVAVHRLPEDLVRSQPSIHGKPRHERDYMDAGHDSAETYQGGRGEERRFTIPLAGAKRPRA